MQKNEIKPVKAMMAAIDMLWGSFRGDQFRNCGPNHWAGKPGAVIKFLPQEYRNALKDLKSKDFDKMWFDVYYCDQEFAARQRYIKLLMEFDKKIVKI